MILFSKFCYTYIINKDFQSKEGGYYPYKLSDEEFI